MPGKFYISICENAKDLPLPKYMTNGAVAMDLYANILEDVILSPSKFKLIPTGIKIALPKGYEAQIRPRSGLALNNGISVLNTPGTIDSDYRGELKILLINFAENDFVIKRGFRIAQMVINKVELVNFNIVDNLDKTERGEQGYGHTGV